MSGMLRAGALMAFAVISLGLAAPAARAQSLTIEDQRTTKLEKSSHVSLNIYSCGIGIQRVSDRFRAKDRVQKLQEDLTAALGAELAGRRLVLKDYRLYLNYSTDIVAQARQVGANAAGAAVGMPGVGGLPEPGRYGVHAKCTEDKTPEGWFAASEVSGRHSPLIVHVTLEVDGRPYTVRIVHSPDMVLQPSMRSLWAVPKDVRELADPAASVEVETAFAKANTALIEQIRAGLLTP